MDGAAIIVPRREDGGHRDRLWAHVQAHLEDGGFTVLEGHHDGPDPFSRSLALNLAADQAGDGVDVLVVHDSDTIVAHDQIASAVEIASATGRVAFGFHRYAAVSRSGTGLILDGFDGDWEPFVDYEFDNTASSCLAVRRDLWDRAGGFDPRFVGWGFEDVAASLAFQTIGGGMHRVGGTAWHLFHEQAAAAGDDRSPIWRANQALCEPYRLAFGDPVAMAEVIRSRDL